MLIETLNMTCGDSTKIFTRVYITNNPLRAFFKHLIHPVKENNLLRLVSEEKIPYYYSLLNGQALSLLLQLPFVGP